MSRHPSLEYLLAVWLAHFACLAGEEGAPPPPPPGPPPAAAAPDAPKENRERVNDPERREQMRHARQIMARKEAGEALTAEDREFLEQHGQELQKAQRRMGAGERDGRAGAGPGQGPGPGPGMEPRQGPSPLSSFALRPLLEEINVADRASLSLALAKFQNEKKDEAIALAEKVADAKNADPEAAGVARLILARMLSEKGEKDAAARMFRTVTGHAAVQALANLLEPLARGGDSDGLLTAFKDLLAAQPDALGRCRVLKALLDLADRFGAEVLSAPALEKILQAAAGSVSAEEALANREALAKENQAPFNRPPPGPMGPPGMRMGEGAQGGLGQEIMQKLMAARALPPDQRQEAIKDIKTMLDKGLEDRGREAPKDPPKDELRRKIPKELKEKEKAARKEGKDPEKMRAEIKRLEEEGKPDEANKLKQDLELIDHPIGELHDKF